MAEQSFPSSLPGIGSNLGLTKVELFSLVAMHGLLASGYDSEHRAVWREAVRVAIDTLNQAQEKEEKRDSE